MDLIITFIYREKDLRGAARRGKVEFYVGLGGSLFPEALEKR